MPNRRNNWSALYSVNEDPWFLNLDRNTMGHPLSNPNYLTRDPWLLPNMSNSDDENPVLLERGTMQNEEIADGSSEPEIVVTGRRNTSVSNRRAADHVKVQQGNKDRITRSTSLAEYEGNEESERVVLSKNGMRTTADPTLAGLNREIRRRIANFESPGKIAFFLEQIQPGLGKEILPQLRETTTFRKLNPRVPMSNYHINVENIEIPLSQEERQRNAEAQTNVGAFEIAVADVLTAGNLNKLAQDPDRVRMGMDQVATEHPISTTMGTVMGGALASEGLGELALAARMGRAAPVVADTVFGAGYGAGSNDQDRLQGAVTGALGGLLFSGVGRGVANARRELRAQAKYENDIQKYINQGRNVRDAVHLASPYTGMGEHFIPRNAKVSYLGRPIRLPKLLSESKFNVLKPRGISRGDMYELHYRVDPNFHGTRLLTRGRGKGWSGKNLGLTKYGTFGKLWYGTPRDLKMAIAAPLLGAALYEMPDEQRVE